MMATRLKKFSSQGASRSAVPFPNGDTRDDGILRNDKDKVRPARKKCLGT